MRPDDWADYDVQENAGFASLTGVDLRRPAQTRDKKSDITEALAAMRPTPRYIHADAPLRDGAMRDVTPPNPGDIVAFWDGLRNSRPMPSRDAIRASDIAARWPNLILFRRGAGGALQPDSAFATALRAQRKNRPGGLHDGAVEVSAMLSQWILGAARNAMLKAVPVRDRSSFDGPGGRVSYALTALPLGCSEVDHVLCTVERAAT